MGEFDFDGIFADLEERNNRYFEDDKTRADNVANTGNFVRGLKSGVDQLEATGYGAVGLLGDALDLESVRDFGFEGYQANMDEAGLNPTDVQNFTDISTDEGVVETLSDTGKWFAGTLGQLAPSMATALVSSVVGAAAGTAAAGPVGTVSGGLAGAFGRKLAIEQIDNAVASLTKQGMTRALAEETVKKQVIKRAAAANIGANIGITESTAVMEGGGMWGEDAAANGVENANAGSAFLLSQISGASEVVSPGGALIKRLTGVKGTVSPIVDKVSDTFLKRLGTEVPKAMGGEAAQEVFQSFLGVLNQKIADPTVSLTDKKAIHEYVNSGAAGAAGGLVFGAAGAVFPEKSGLEELPENHTVDDVIDDYKAGKAVEAATARQGIKAAVMPVASPAADTVPEVLGMEPATTTTTAGATVSDIGQLAETLKGMEASLYPEPGDEGPHVLPDWAKLKALKDHEKATGEPIKSYVNSTSIKTTLAAIRESKPLDEKQTKVWDYLRGVATSRIGSDQEAVAAASEEEAKAGQAATAATVATEPIGDGFTPPSTESNAAVRKAEAATEEQYDGEQGADLTVPIAEETSTEEIQRSYGSKIAAEVAKARAAGKPISVADAANLAGSVDEDPFAAANSEPVPEPTSEKHEVVDNVESVAHAQEYNPEPTQAQAEKGNYKKAHVSVDGLDVTIENPAGSTRSGTDADGKTWSTEMKSDYGYFLGTRGKDKDHVDVVIAPGYQGGAADVFVVNQHNKDGSFDEHKTVLGVSTEEEAMAVYNANYEDGWDGGKTVARMPVAEFKEWVKSDAPAQGPAAGAVAVTTKQPQTEGVTTDVETTDMDATGTAVPDSQETNAESPVGGLPSVRSDSGQAESNQDAGRDTGGDNAAGVAGGQGRLEAEGTGGNVQKESTHLTKKGKLIKGIVRTDLTKEEAKKIDPYTFKKDGGFFIREKYIVAGEKAAPKKDNDTALAEYFTRGNIVKSYGGRHDKVVQFHPAADGKPWSVDVVTVEKNDSGDWVETSTTVRHHNTMPGKRELAAGPVRVMRTKQGYFPENGDDGSKMEKPGIQDGGKLLGKNKYGNDVFEDETGRYYLDSNGMKNRPPRPVGPDGRKMESYSLSSLYNSARNEYLTSEEEDKIVGDEQAKTTSLNPTGREGKGAEKAVDELAAAKEPWQKKLMDYKVEGQLANDTERIARFERDKADYQKAMDGDAEIIAEEWARLEKSNMARPKDGGFGVLRGRDWAIYETKEKAAQDSLRQRAGRRGGGDKPFDQNGERHRKAVVKALKEGKDVPAEVLEDYPDPIKEKTGAAGDGTAGAFAGNKIFTQSAVDAARARLKAKRSSLSSGFDPELIQDVFIVGGAHFEAGVRSFVEWSKEVLADIGEEFKPYLPGAYENLRRVPGLDTEGMSPTAEVDAEPKESTKPEQELAAIDDEIESLYQLLECLKA